MTGEFRRARRREVDGTVPVIDAMLDARIGRLGNVSESGLLLIAHAVLHDDALYQLRFELRGPDGAPFVVEAGTHLLWTSDAHAPGQTWAGLRFITVPEAQMRALRRWLDAPGARYR